MKISAVLLAGGESRRMGQDKATLLFRGKPLWLVHLDLLRALQPAEIFVSARKDLPWRPSDVQFVPDTPPSRGPLSGLAAALRVIRTEYLVALAVDMPFMDETHLRFLCGQITPGCGVLPLIGDRAEPLSAIYPVAADADFADALARSDFSLQTLAKQLVEHGKLRLVRVTQQDEGFYRNLNEPADLVTPLEPF